MPAPEKPALLYPGYTDIIDISKYQGRPDFKKVKAAGFRGVVVKVSEGTNQCDGSALYNLQAARDADLYTMIYAFARPEQGHPDQQVAKMFDCAGDTMPHRSVMDLETTASSWTPEQKVAFAEAFIEAALKWSILPPMLYTFPNFAKLMQPALGNSVVLAQCPLWIAHYMSTTSGWVPPLGFTPYVPKPFTTWAMHQYSGDGGFRVPGIAGDCDRNLFNGDEAALREFFGLPETTEEADSPIVHPAIESDPTA
jgi:lysozyme